MKSDELNLIKKAINGDRESFSALIEYYYDMIFRIAYKWCGNKEDAEDIAQESCIKIAQSLSGFKMESKFSSWIYRIVINTANDLYRKKKYTVSDVIEEIESDEADATEIIYCKQLWQTVHKLPDKQRDAVLLVYSEGLNHNEAAEVMQCAESTVSWYIMEAKKTLKQMMK
ncbi:MAG: RNA polymerase subunit sigma-70 [Alphaproteobacteria bacterium CG11_big_fil_rev_8_21_14_0_20_39_49]|nr:MAG: RNA polymerase subunit sigma-70 [Alphaproteobacteria bacterium CG11_big_fil_rev_8_21_14_0_20_39_49]